MKIYGRSLGKKGPGGKLEDEWGPHLVSLRSNACDKAPGAGSRGCLYVPLCNYHLFVSVGGAGVAVDLRDQFGKVDRDRRRAKISLNPRTEPNLATVLTITTFRESWLPSP